MILKKNHFLSWPVIKKKMIKNLYNLETSIFPVYDGGYNAAAFKH